jgi:phospholipid transport system substrate-binding protein
MMKTLKIFAILVLALGLTSPLLAAPHVSPAAAVVGKFYATLTATMKQGDQLGFSGRYKKLEPAIRTSFDLPAMTRFAVGPTWLKATPAQQQQLVSAFSDFSIATYANRFAAYDGEKFDIVGERPTADGGVIVETKLTPKGDAPVPLNYLMKKDDQGNYRIIDVFLDGSISELATRRSEFSAIVKSDGIPALVDQLDKKSKEMGPS